MRDTPMRGILQALLSLTCVIGVAAGGVFPSAASAEPILVIDAVADPGVDLFVTFVPQGDVAGGLRRVAGHQSVVTTAPVDLSAALPVSWMVSVLKKGDVAANISTRPIADQSGSLVFSFPDEMDVTLDDREWQIPHFDSNLFIVDVGFGIGTDIVHPAYSVRCRPGQSLKMAPGTYQLVRSSGDDATGSPIGQDVESWDIPTNADSRLVFDSRGNGILGPLR